MKFLKCISVIALFFISHVCVFSQQEGVPQPSDFSKYVNPPMAEAATLGMADEAQLSLHTGSYSYPILLHQIEGKKLSVPITINYTGSKGIPVQEYPSRVGQGWTLNFGGAITRTVRGAPDEGVLGSGVNGYFFSTGDNGLYQLPEDDSGFNQFSDYQKYSQSLAPSIDLQPDLFQYNFNGKSGSFVFDQNDTVYTIPYEKIKIIPSITPSIGIVKFLIIDTDGTQYHFEDVAKETVLGVDSYLLATQRVSAWYLSKIVSVDGTDEINFNYSTTNYTKEMGHSKTKGYSAMGNDPGCPSQSSFDSDGVEYQNKMRVDDVVLTSIISSKERIDFQLEARADIPGDFRYTDMTINKIGNLFNHKSMFFVYYPYTNNRYFLNKIDYWYNDGNTITNNPGFSFQYIQHNSLPDRTSTSYDHWGYFRGGNFSGLIPIEMINGKPIFQNGKRNVDETTCQYGLLNKITVPTGGEIEFDYESNTYTTTSNSHPSESLGSSYVSVNQDFQFDIDNTNLQDGYFDTSPFFIDFIQWVKIDLRSFCIESNCGPEPLTGTFKLYLQPDINQGDIQLIETFNPSEGIDIEYNLYLQEGRYFIRYENFSVPGQSGHISVNYFVYNPLSTYNANNRLCGGNRIKKITYKAFDEQPDKVEEYFYKDGSGRSTGEISHYPHYYYDFRLIKFNDAGGIDPEEEPDFFPEQNTCLYYILKANSILPLTASGGPIQYRSVDKKITSELNTGKIRYTYSLGSIIGNYTLPFPPHTSLEHRGGLLLKEETLNEGNTLLKKVENFYEFQDVKKVAGYTVALRLDHKVPGPPTTYYEENYSTPSEFIRLDSTIVTTYDQDGLNPVVQKESFSYENFNLVEKNMVNSNWDIYKTQFKYAEDYDCGIPSCNNFITVMQNKNLTAIPIEVVKSVNGNVVAATFNEYNNNGLLHKIYKLKTDVPLTDFQFGQLDIDNVIKDNRYETVPEVELIYFGNGQLSFVQNPHIETYTALNWDASGNYLTHKRIRKLTTTTVGESVAEDWITTYNYDNLFRLQSVVDKNGQTNYFKYHPDGKLKNMKDTNQDLIESYNYHYKNQ